MYKNELDVAESLAIAEDINLEYLENINWSQVGLSLDQEATMDAALEFKPTSPYGPPERTIFSGDLKFEVEICGAHTNKSKYLYSHRLNRIYVDMGYSFSVQFKWDAPAQPHAEMYVRAAAVFSDQAQAEKRVTRCIQHYHDTANNGTEMPEVMRMNVLHSARGAGTQDVWYCGAAESPDCWLSVLVRLAAPTTHAYQFACKNSCSSGINRRTIAIIFTLEDYTGKVYGRQTVGARVCSCPKRDISREESEAPRGKKPLPLPATPAQPKPKKVRLEVDTDELIQLPPITVVGRRTLNTGLNVMLSMMEEKRALALRAHQPADDLDAAIAQLRAQLGKPDPHT